VLGLLWLWQASQASAPLWAPGPVSLSDRLRSGADEPLWLGPPVEVSLSDYLRGEARTDPPYYEPPGVVSLSDTLRSAEVPATENIGYLRPIGWT